MYTKMSRVFRLPGYDSHVLDLDSGGLLPERSHVLRHV